MMKIALRNAEYMASLPPYRFDPGDVIEVDDDWGNKLIQRGIGIKAKANAKTALERRLALRPLPADDGGAAVRAERRATLLAELDTLDRQDAAPDDDDEEEEEEDEAPAPPRARPSAAQGHARPSSPRAPRARVAPTSGVFDAQITRGDVDGHPEADDKESGGE